MSADPEQIRSYQRVFAPERRIHQVEGHSLPVPGGVPLRWLAYAAAGLAAVIALSARSPAVCLLAGAMAALAGRRAGGPRAAALAGAAALGAAWIAGLGLGLLSWPLRLAVLPAAAATLATQVAPDGRRADRFALSWLAVRLAPRRRSLGRALPAAGLPRADGGELWVAPDERSPRLRRGRVRGPALVFLSSPVVVRRAALRSSRLRTVPAGRPGGEGKGVTRLRLGEGETLEVRP